MFLSVYQIAGLKKKKTLSRWILGVITAEKFALKSLEITLSNIKKKTFLYCNFRLMPEGLGSLTAFNGQGLSTFCAASLSVL